MDKDIARLIDNSILLSSERKCFFKKNFCIFSQKKQKNILKILNQTKDFSAKVNDFEVFSYSMNVWKNKKKLQFLELQEL